MPDNRTPLSDLTDNATVAAINAAAVPTNPDQATESSPAICNRKCLTDRSNHFQAALAADHLQAFTTRRSLSKVFQPFQVEK